MAIGLRSSLVSILAIWAVAGPALTWFGMRTHEAVVVSGARKAARLEEVARCQKQLAEQALMIDANVRAGVDEAIGAANAIGTTPEDRAARVALCKADEACIEREALP